MPVMLNLDGIHPPIAALLTEELDLVGLIIERQLASDMPAVTNLCRHVERYRGKMLRPSLVLLSGLAAAPDRAEGEVLTENHRILAAVTELIHMATLVHDDVLDEADLRRGGETVNHLWGNEAAVILGDYLISNAFHLCSSMGDPAINLALGEITNTMCEGELVQLHHRNDFTIDEAAYLEVIRRKTARLLGECCRLGAALSDADENTCDALKRFGLALGLAFQIQDDVLDLTGDQATAGKSLGTDLNKGKLTLPMIYFLNGPPSLTPPSQTAPATRDRAETLKLLAGRDLDSIRAALIASGAAARAAGFARSLTLAAIGELESIPPSPARDLLSSLADQVASRTS